MIEIDLLRHVKVEGKAALYGKTDIPANAAHNHQLLASLVNKTSIHYPKDRAYYDDIFSSPLQRCASFAQLYAKKYRLTWSCLDAMQEMNFGVFDGVIFDELDSIQRSVGTMCQSGYRGERVNQAGKLTKYICSNWQLLEKFWQSPATQTLPEAESLATFQQRVVGCWQQMIRDIALTQQNSIEAKVNDKCHRRVLLVCHGGVIRIILANLLKLDWENPSWYQGLKIENASITKIIVSGYEGKFTGNCALNLLTDVHYQIRQIGTPLLSSSNGF